MFGKTNTSNKRLQEFLEILFGNFHVLARALGMAAPMLASFSGKPSQSPRASSTKNPGRWLLSMDHQIGSNWYLKCVSLSCKRVCYLPTSLPWNLRN